MAEKTVGNYIKEMAIRTNYRKYVPSVAISPGSDEALKVNVTNSMFFRMIVF